VVAKALTGDMEIHWTTIADFVSANSEDFKKVFTEVLGYCNELELVGGEDFAVDGLRLPSNASLDMSGTKQELGERVEVYRKMAEKHLARHKEADERGEVDESCKQRFEKRQKELIRRMENISNFFNSMEGKPGKCVKEVKSNVTDNESAMIHSSKGYLQGYIGIAVSDSKNQIIVSAEAVGTANEGEHLPELLEQTLENLENTGVKRDEKKPQTFLADSNYFSEENLRACAESGVEALIPDGQRKTGCDATGRKHYEAADFKYHEEENCYECPAGKKLSYKGVTKLRAKEVKIYQGSFPDCKGCSHFEKCFHTKKRRTEINQGRKLLIGRSNEPGNLCAQMRIKMATEEWKVKYSRRIQIVEPVFANIGYCKGLNRFMLRGKKKVNGQWLLYCMVHNLGKCLNEYTKRANAA
jgi:phage anti-repressor protein